MILDIIKAALPRPWYTFILLVAFLLWVGYQAREVSATVEKHYAESTVLVQINRHICKGIYTHARLPIPKSCEVE